MLPKDYYYLLGVPPSATTYEIKIAFRKLSQKMHPDKNESESFYNHWYAQALEAYTTLSDPTQRAAYDAVYWLQQKQTTRYQSAGIPAEQSRLSDLDQKEQLLHEWQQRLRLREIELADEYFYWKARKLKFVILMLLVCSVTVGGFMLLIWYAAHR